MRCESSNGGNASDYVAVDHVFGRNALNLINEAFEIPQAVLTTLYLVNDCYNPSLEGIMTLTVGNRHNFLTVNLTV